MLMASASVRDESQNSKVPALCGTGLWDDLWTSSSSASSLRLGQSHNPSLVRQALRVQVAPATAEDPLVGGRLKNRQGMWKRAFRRCIQGEVTFIGTKKGRSAGTTTRSSPTYSTHPCYATRAELSPCGTGSGRGSVRSQSLRDKHRQAMSVSSEGSKPEPALRAYAK